MQTVSNADSIGHWLWVLTNFTNFLSQLGKFILASPMDMKSDPALTHHT